MELNYVVMDLETTVRCPIGNNKASPHWPENEIVLQGLLWTDGTIDIQTDIRWPMDETMMYVGQNIKFDTLYRYKTTDNTDFKIHGNIWDTQLAEYLLTGQQTKYASLDALATKYGGTLKDNRIKEMWDAGVQTEDIPQDMLKEYLIQDLKNTELVFHAQIKEAVRLNMLPLIKSQMDALMATIEMEANGLAFDSKRALELMQKSSREIRDIERVLCELMSDAGIPEPNLNSKAHVSAMLFGGGIPVETTEVVMEDGVPYIYKTGAKKGEIKTRKVTTVIKIAGYGCDVSRTSPTKSGVYTVNEEVLVELSQDKGNKKASVFCELMLKHRELYKDISTYYKPYIELVYPDGKIHGNINHCSTNTGRLSSTNPNLQNVTNREDD